VSSFLYIYIWNDMSSESRCDFDYSTCILGHKGVYMSQLKLLWFLSDTLKLGV
jgi:hypothetical protein